MPDEVLDDTGRPQLADPESAERLGFRPEVRDQRFARAAPFVCLRHLSRSFLAAQAYHPVPYLARFHQRRRCRGVPSRRADRVGSTARVPAGSARGYGGLREAGAPLWFTALLRLLDAHIRISGECSTD